VSDGSAEFGVVPIENSTEGGVNQTVDELLNRDLHVHGEVVLEIAQCLLGLTPDLSKILRVASHPQGLAQCRRWLAEHLPNAEQVASLSTTAAAREAAHDPQLAAISNALAGELNGLMVIREGIQDSAENATRSPSARSQWLAASPKYPNTDRNQVSGASSAVRAPRLSGSDRERCFVLNELDRRCKKHRLGVSLRMRGRLHTPDPARPLNFWWYEAQTPLDTAPVKRRA